jgi:hypothetical protein
MPHRNIHSLSLNVGRWWRSLLGGSGFLDFDRKDSKDLCRASNIWGLTSEESGETVAVLLLFVSMRTIVEGDMADKYEHTMIFLHLRLSGLIESEAGAAPSNSIYTEALVSVEMQLHKRLGSASDWAY